MTIQNRIYKSQIQGLQEAETTAGPFDSPKYGPNQWGPYQWQYDRPVDPNWRHPMRPGQWQTTPGGHQWLKPGYLSPKPSNIPGQPPAPRPPLNLSGKALLAWLIRFFMKAGLGFAAAQKMANEYMETNPISNPQDLNPGGNPLPPGDHQQNPVPWGNPQG